MAYLDTKPPVRDQWFTKRNRALTGCTVLHTAESVMDSVGPDTGAESVAEFIRTRTTPGSYHDLVDSDSWIQLVGLDHGAYHDGTGSNNWALSISFACRTSDWRAMSSEKRRGFLRQGARAFIAQQAYRKARGFPLTELRLISKAQSDAGQSGFTYHGLRDPGRRTDPGVTAPNLFPFNEFIEIIRAEMAGNQEEDDMFSDNDRQLLKDVLAMAAWNVDAVSGEPSRDGVRISRLADNLREDTPPTTVLGSIRAGVARLEGLVAGQSEAIRQLAAAPGQPVDLEAVFKAARDGSAAGASSIIDNLRVVADPPEVKS